MKNKVLLVLVLVCTMNCLIACSEGEKTEKPETKKNSTVVEDNESEKTLDETKDISENETYNDTSEEETYIWETEKYSHFLKPGEACTYECDIDNDGEYENIILYASQSEKNNEFPKTRISIEKDGEKIYESDYILEGAKEYCDNDVTYYVLNEGGKNYLMCYTHFCWQGQEYWEYNVMSIMSDGENEVVKTDKANLSGGVWFVENDIEANEQFYNTMMSYYENNDMTLLLSRTSDYCKMIYSTKEHKLTQKDRLENEPFEQVINEDSFEALGIEWNENDTWKEKLTAYNEYLKTIS